MPFQNSQNGDLGTPIVTAEPVNVYDDVLFNGFTNVVELPALCRLSPTVPLKQRCVRPSAAQHAAAKASGHDHRLSRHHRSLLRPQISFLRLLSTLTNLLACFYLTSCNISARCEPQWPTSSEAELRFRGKWRTEPADGAVCFERVQGLSVCRSQYKRASGDLVATCFDTISSTVCS